MPARTYPRRWIDMGIQIKNLAAIDLAVQKRFDKLTPVFSNALEIEKGRIISRTQSGVDIYGKKFKKYSSQRANERKKAGLQTRVVDLTATGAMFRALKVQFSRDGNKLTGILSFGGGSESDKAAENEYLGRSFFGLSEEQIEIIKNRLRQVS